MSFVHVQQRVLFKLSSFNNKECLKAYRLKLNQPLPVTLDAILLPGLQVALLGGSALEALIYLQKKSCGSISAVPSGKMN